MKVIWRHETLAGEYNNSPISAKPVAFATVGYSARNLHLVN